jgi:hypothetical protein
VATHPGDILQMGDRAPWKKPLKQTGQSLVEPMSAPGLLESAKLLCLGARSPSEYSLSPFEIVSLWNMAAKARDGGNES